LEVKISYSGEHDNPIAANIASCAQPQCGLGVESGRCEGDYHTQGKSLAGWLFIPEDSCEGQTAGFLYQGFGGGKGYTRIVVRCFARCDPLVKTVREQGAYAYIPTAHVARHVIENKENIVRLHLAFIRLIGDWMKNL